MKIYTRTGDSGSTSLLDGQRVAKSDARIELCGAVDEVNSFLGLALTGDPALVVADCIRQVQSDLFILGADFATPTDPAPAFTALRIGTDEILRLENSIDDLTAKLPELRNFILPGGTPSAAHLHVARAICRRAERLASTLIESLNAHGFVYLNRLSDFLFTLARMENHIRGVGDPVWTAPK